MKFFAMLLFSICAIGRCMSTFERFTALAKRILLGPSDLEYSHSIIFDANQGEINRDRYIRAFGFQGQLLVEAYGKGFSKKELQDLGYL